VNSQIQIDGRLTRPAESKTLDSGKLAAKMSVAVKCWNKDTPAWVGVQGYEKTAEKMRNLTTGNRVLVFGRLDYYVGKDSRQNLYVVADKVVYVPKVEAAAAETAAAAECAWE